MTVKRNHVPDDLSAYDLDIYPSIDHITITLIGPRGGKYPHDDILLSCSGTTRSGYMLDKEKEVIYRAQSLSWDLDVWLCWTQATNVGTNYPDLNYFRLTRHTGDVEQLLLDYKNRQGSVFLNGLRARNVVNSHTLHERESLIAFMNKHPHIPIELSPLAVNNHKD